LAAALEICNRADDSLIVKMEKISEKNPAGLLHISWLYVFI